MNGNKINVAVIGATGYVGLDLVFLLSLHPKVKILNLCATKNIGSKISRFDKRLRKKLPIISDVNKVEWNKIDLIFLLIFVLLHLVTIKILNLFYSIQLY